MKSYADLKTEKTDAQPMEQAKKDEDKAMIKQVRELFKKFNHSWSTGRRIG